MLQMHAVELFLPLSLPSLPPFPISLPPSLSPSPLSLSPSLTLTQNVVLSGGSTMFKDFGRRLQRDLKRTVEARLKLSEELSGGRIKVRTAKMRDRRIFDG